MSDAGRQFPPCEPVNTFPKCNGSVYRLGWRALLTGTPTRIVRPVAFVTSYAVSIPSATPVFSTATSTPCWPTTFRIPAAASSRGALIVWVGQQGVDVAVEN